MKLLRIVAATGLAAALAGLGVVGQDRQPPAAAMADAAQRFLESLGPELRARAQFKYDDPERLRWNFVPLQDRERKPTRKGVRLEEMSESQKAAALALVKAGTSPSGFTQATTIMSLEAILHELEGGRGNVRHPGWYFVTVFGTPAATGQWGWRIEGHHLSLNFALDGGKVVSATPSFFGANPAEVKAGDKKGLRTLPEVEDLARELFKSLTDEQRQVALQPKQLPEVDNTPATGQNQPIGLAAEKMTTAQRETLQKLIRAYTNRLPAEVGAAEYQAALAGGIEKVHFAYAGGTEPGKPYTYQVHGPTFVVQFLNVQADSARNPANHIHSAWRRLPADFGQAK